MLERMQSKENMPPLLVEMQTCTTILEISMAVSRKLGINLLQDPVIPLLGIDPKESQSHYKNICSTMFIEALFAIAKTWKQPKCPSTDDEWVKKMYIYTMEYYSEVKKQTMTS